MFTRRVMTLRRLFIRVRGKRRIKCGEGCIEFSLGIAATILGEKKIRAVNVAFLPAKNSLVIMKQMVPSGVFVQFSGVKPNTEDQCGQKKCHPECSEIFHAY